MYFVQNEDERSNFTKTVRSDLERSKGALRGARARLPWIAAALARGAVSPEGRTGNSASARVQTSHLRQFDVLPLRRVANAQLGAQPVCAAQRALQLLALLIQLPYLHARASIRTYTQ